MNTILEDIALAARISQKHAAPKRSLGDALAAPIAVIRIRWNGRVEGERAHELTAYSAAHDRVPLAPRARDRLLNDARETFPSACWQRSWDWHLDTGQLWPAPTDPDARGYIPELDHTFGSGPIDFTPRPPEPLDIPLAVAARTSTTVPTGRYL